MTQQTDDKPLRRIVIVGGGTAGWLTAAVLAAGHDAALPSGVEITLVESPDVSTIGVGEGTWPSLRDTLMRAGIPERDFIRECAVSFKQGSKFVGWRRGDDPGDYYYHPFSLPQGYLDSNLVPYWQAEHPELSFAAAFSTQESLCEAGRAPKQAATPDYAAVANYAYHLDAGLFAEFLRRHCTDRLGVRHVLDHVEQINGCPDGDIESLGLRKSVPLEGDLFIDCSGGGALLLGRHYGVPLISQRDVLFNDRAVALQVPYHPEHDAIASATVATARSCGWIWDIGLPTRRGVGYVFASDYQGEQEAAQCLLDYVSSHPCTQPGLALEPRLLKFNPGYRERFWHRNCVAVGMASGFIEPLEASAIAMVELSAAAIRDELPAGRRAMDTVAERFNARFRDRWERVIDFLKLHYLVSQREDSPYWLDHRSGDSTPERLAQLLDYWQYQPPSRFDLPQIDQIFPSASYQYVLYGMGFRTRARATSCRRDDFARARQHFEENRRLAARQLGGLPSNRELLEQLQGGVA